MHAPFYGISPTDIAQLSLYIQTNKAKDKSLGYWRLVTNNALLLETQNLKTSEAIRRFGACIERWLSEQSALPLPLLLEKIIYESGIVKYLLQTKDYTWNIQVLNTFFDYVKELHSSNNRINIAELLRMLTRMQDENIALPIQKVVQNEHGVKFYTAHGAKGNEFEYVFLIACTKNLWEAKKGGGNEYKLPDTITNTNDDTDKTYKTEVARRLFYVALTRAKKHLYVSYAQADNNGKPLENSVFIDEISTPQERIPQAVDTNDVVKHIQWAINPVPDVKIELANNQWIDHVLQQFIMSYTSLSKYIRCPLTFYYETVLKVPFQKNDALAFGSAIHYALERMFKTMKENRGVFPSKEDVINTFNFALHSEAGSFTPIQFDRRKEQGHTLLSEYYDENINHFKTNVEIELKIPRFMLDGVPVTGKIDKIELDTDGINCTVIDYKTGDPDKSAAANLAPPNEKEPMGGDYWRQMVFYKLLIENYQERNWKVTMGMFEYLEKSKKSNGYKRPQVPIFAHDEEVVRKQIKDSYIRIMNHDFDKGCGKEDCYWCNFAKKYELVRPAEVVEIDDM